MHRRLAVRVVLAVAFGGAAVALSLATPNGGDAASAAPGDPVCATSGATVTCTFAYNGTSGQDGSPQTWIVPTGVTSVVVDAFGAQGAQCQTQGGCSFTYSGMGGEAVATKAVSPGQSLIVRVGGSPQTSGGGYNGGGVGDTVTYPVGGSFYGGGGGGASDVRTGAGALSDRFVIGGGGGGSTWYVAGSFTGWVPGGDGGGTSGADGTCVGSQGTCVNGFGGSATAGGAAGPGAGAGVLGIGGNGAGGLGAGAGGGYYGGGGSEANMTYQGGAGGGSGYVTGGCATPPAGSSCTKGGRQGNGLVTISYSTLAAAPTKVIAAPGTSSATLSWLRPAAGLSPITGYTVTPFVGGSPLTPVLTNSTATTTTVTGLLNGSSYTFTVAATSANGTGPPSAPSNAITAGSPGQPVLASATQGDGSALVKWWAPSGNAGPINSYVITPYINGVAQPSTFFPSSANGETVTGLTNGTAYSFTIVANNAYGAGPASTATAPVIVGTPAAPVLQSAVQGDSSAVVKWWPPSGNGAIVRTYVITPYIGTVAQPTQSFPTAANSVTVAGLTNGTSYTFRIAAVNSLGTGVLSAPTAAVVVGTPAPPVLQSAIQGNGTALVKWYPPSGNGSPVLSYVITPFRGTVAQPPQSFPTTANSDTVTGLSNGVDYTFKIAAVNAYGPGVLSAATASVIIGTPAAPVLQSATTGEFSAVVRWWPPSGNAAPVTGYVITPYLNGFAQPAQTFHSTANSDTVTSLANGGTYTFKIAATNTLGPGVLSAATPPIVVGAPSAPAAPTAAAGAQKAKVNWVAPADNGAPVTGYVVTPYLDGIAQPPITFGAVTSATITGLTTGGNYTFKVAAINSRGTGLQSAASKVITVL